MFLFVSALEFPFIRSVRGLVVLTFGKAGISSVDFAMRYFDVGFQHCFTISWQSLFDRFDIGLATNKKVIK